ncbi:enoyl-CoA hydratase-related protein [Lentibacter sp. XHP0401]|jgi:2-(1,2-epoxy-1,2-dihydrophenyl)acetyl-CoA isomerase|uniref:enoyl-CoA hydratase-related protein n=1 Tax=Lentibacter sp. XHP0401 TaxID=2984334 RepID=UPI0021E8DC01|nr:enoyl-CoA hydratase-related protein [Lentibacter sp. XHP0401]MCV2892282.1 enoyl-CoA hydratase-related protein [Lentibacter sp. XHP0401]
MNFETITYELNTDGYAVISLNRPDKMNAMTPQMRAEIPAALREALANGARAIVLTGTGKAFCSGQDLGDGGNAAHIDLERILRDEYNPMVKTIVDAPVPVIAAVNGAAAGAGANLALCADVVIAAKSAYFMEAFSRIGLIPDAGGTYFLPRLIGPAKAMGAALFAEKISAEEADRMGLIWEHVEDADFEAHWRARAAHLAQGPTEAYHRTKQALHASLNNTLEDQLNLEAREQGRAGKSRDFKEGVLAFLEKRRPQFEGR